MSTPKKISSKNDSNKKISKSDFLPDNLIFKMISPNIFYCPQRNQTATTPFFEVLLLSYLIIISLDMQPKNPKEFMKKI